MGAPTEVPPLTLRDYSRTAIATGQSARNVRELHERAATVPPSSLFHHFWGRLLRSEEGRGEYGNDLAEWAAHRLEDAVLAERMALLDPHRMGDMERVREALCQILEFRTEEVEDRAAEVPPDEAFHFISDQMVIYSTGRSVSRPEELFDELDRLSDAAIFLHFVDPPGLELPEHIGATDWIRRFGAPYEEVASALDDLDVFLMNTTELRERIGTVMEACLPEGVAR